MPQAGFPFSPHRHTGFRIAHLAFGPRQRPQRGEENAGERAGAGLLPRSGAGLMTLGPQAPPSAPLIELVPYDHDIPMRQSRAELRSPAWQ